MAELLRKSAGLSPAHVELINLLAEIAVQNYLKEIEETPSKGVVNGQR